MWYLACPMPRQIDALTSATLKHLRERWWDDAFTDFLQEVLEPRAGWRLLDIGCGTGTAELGLGRLSISQVQLVGVDQRLSRVLDAREQTADHNIRAHFSVADASALPFADASFDSTFCVAVLQHVASARSAVAEFARVTRPGGRVLVVEPDNAARYWYSSSDSGRRAFELGTRFFNALGEASGEVGDPAIGPRLTAMFPTLGIQPLSVRLFPVSVAHLGIQPADFWDRRRQVVRTAVDGAPHEAIRRLGEDYLKLLNRYAEDGRAAGANFVEIQNTMLVATAGQRVGDQ